ncbi:MAG: UDP-N-acetylmuramoyl-tripeptide--D-alanyl-D-alanine ligase [Eubacteriaceae bacterium]|nr:UDP-N-acetylmuramoyl-tripeptide--D-alanyl-D-alanine ligase [Eubacteriaceae bacterium]
MKAKHAQEIADAIGGTIVKGSPETAAHSVCVDSRSAEAGSIFFALKGEFTDGHLYISNAYEAGSAIAIVQRPDESSEICQIQVPDTYKALQDLARAHYRQFSIPAIAVTGSSGKTTTKDLLASLLSQKYITMKTPGNLNSQTGVPLSIFQMESSDEIAVFEVSMSNTGEILPNVEILRPDTVIITNIGVAHIEFLGTRENIFKAKKESLAYLEPEGLAIVNGEDDFLGNMSLEAGKLCKVGIDSGDFTAYEIRMGPQGSEFSINIGGKEERFCFGLAGRHFIIDCLLAIRAALHYGLSADQIRAGLDSFEPSDKRMQSEQIAGICLINDTYNANPASMKASIDSLMLTAGGSISVAVLGDMYELGKDQYEMTKEVGAYCANAGLAVLIAAGESAGAFIEGYRNAGGKGAAYSLDSYAEIAEKAVGAASGGGAILFKASRGMGFEEIYNIASERLHNE